MTNLFVLSWNSWGRLCDTGAASACLNHIKVALLHDDVTNENIFRITGHLSGEFTGHRWISLTNASDTELWCFLWSAPE